MKGKCERKSRPRGSISTRAREGMRKAVDAGITEANQRNAGDFDGLLGTLPAETASVLHGVVGYLRGYLLDEKRLKPETIRRLLGQEAHAQQRGFPSVSQALKDEGICLAIGLLKSILSAVRIKDGSMAWNGRRLDAEEASVLLLSGSSGLRDLRRQQGTRKERRPKISHWIRDQLRYRPAASRVSLWQSAPEWITDEIGQGRFLKRVTEQRKQLRIVRKRKSG